MAGRDATGTATFAAEFGIPRQGLDRGDARRARDPFLPRRELHTLGEPRSWTDHRLWHHACHTVELFLDQTGEVPAKAWAHQGPPHPNLRIAMDMTLGLQAQTLDRLEQTL